jgi:putative MFS transporter
VSRIGAILSIVVFPSLVKSLGLQHALWLFAGAGLFGFLVSLIMAPETKNRSLEEITTALDDTERTREPVSLRP